MNFRRVLWIVFVSFLLVRPGFAAPAAGDNLLRVHWLGLKQIGADTNAAPLMKVWQLPQTIALMAQTFDKLSRCPGHGATNAASALLRPLLDDLIASEFYLELSAPTNVELRTSNSELFLALRLPAARAQLWQTNLAAASAVLASPATPQRIECSRAGDWTLVGVGLNKPIAKTTFAARLSLPSLSSATNFWLEADLNPSRLADGFSLSARRMRGKGRLVALKSNGGGGEVGIFSTLNSQLSTINSLHLSLSGEAGNVLSRGTFNFSRPLETPLPPWEIPTNFIHDSLTCFTAVRGIAPWLAALPAWQKLQLAPPPDQAFFWAQSDAPFLTYFAAPLPDAGSQLSQLAGRLVPDANPWLATNAQGSFQWSTNPPGIVWKDALMLSPVLKPATANGDDWFLGGWYPLNPQDSTPPPADILAAVLGPTNLVYYQTEDTGQRVQDGQFINQLLRAVFRRPQLPSDVAVWLGKIEPLLGQSTTIVTRSGPELVFTRHSAVGLTALELHLLADWLASPQFPRDLYTFSAPPGKNP